MQTDPKPPSYRKFPKRLTVFLRRQARRIIPKLYQVSAGFWDFIFHRSLTRITQFARKNPLKIFIVILTLFAVEVWDFWSLPTAQVVINHWQTRQAQEKLKELSPTIELWHKNLEQQREIEKLNEEIKRLKSLKETPLGGVVSGVVVGYPVGECPPVSLTNPVSVMNIVQRWSSRHPAIDISGDYGTPVYAPYSAKVAVAGWQGDGYGLTLWLNLGGGWQIRLAHLSSVSVVVGQVVSAGQKVGGMGSTGNARGVHTHAEILCSGEKLDIAKYLE